MAPALVGAVDDGAETPRHRVKLLYLFKSSTLIAQYLQDEMDFIILLYSKTCYLIFT